MPTHVMVRSGLALDWNENDAGTGAPTVMDEDLYTNDVDVSGCDTFSVTFKHTTGTSPVGTIKLQTKNEDGTGYLDVPDSEVSVPISGLTHRWNVTNDGHRLVRLYYTFTSGTAVASASVNARRNA